MFVITKNNMEINIEIKMNIVNINFETIDKFKHRTLISKFNNLVKSLRNTKLKNIGNIELFIGFLNTVTKKYLYEFRKNKLPTLIQLNQDCYDDFLILEFSEKSIVYNDLSRKFQDLQKSDILDICNSKYISYIDTKINGINGKYIELAPLNKHRKFRGCKLSFDIETSNLNGIYSMISFSIADNSHNWAYTTTEIYNNNELIEHFLYIITECSKDLKNKKISIDVHNLSFDLSFILNYFLKELNFKCVYLEKNEKLKNGEISLIYNQGIIKCDFMYNDILIVFTDTFRIMSKSLDSISSFLKSDYIIRKKDTNYEYKLNREIGEKYTHNEIVYCINDVIVLSYIKEFFSNILFGKMKLTSSSIAMSEWELSTQYGMYNIEIYKKAIAENIKKGFITEKNYKNYIKNGYFKSYYNENVKAGDTFNEFCKIVFNSEISIKDINKFCLKQSLVYNYCLYELKWSTMFIITYFLQTSNIKHFKKQEEIRQQAIKFYLPNINYEIDKKFRTAYGGGVTTCNLTKIGNIYNNLNGKSIDINSSYPDKCRNYLMPIGLPQKIENVQEVYKKISQKGYKDNKLYILKCKLSVHLKKGMLPIIINSSNQFSQQTQISNGEVTRYFTLQELNTIKEVYNTICVCCEIYYFNTSDFIFSAYYDRYFKIKSQSKGTAFYEISKVLLNGLYGKFGENLFLRAESYTLAIIDNEKLKFKTFELSPNYEEIEGKYLFVALFITSFARCQLINGVTKLVKSGCEVFYTDTDSIYFNTHSLNVKIGNTNITNITSINDIPKNTHGNLIINDIDTEISISSELGAWDLEHIFFDFGCFAPKRYGLREYNKECEIENVIRCAGISRKFTENFKIEDLQYNTIHKTLHSVMDNNGRQLITDFKQLNYKNGNIYKCTDNSTLVTPATIYKKVGDISKNVYGENKIICEIIHEN